MRGDSSGRGSRIERSSPGRAWHTEELSKHDAIMTPNSGDPEVSRAICHRCGAPFQTVNDGAGQSPHRLANSVCPACLLRLAALGTGVDSLPNSPWVPPTIEELAPAFEQLEVLELIGHGGMGAI